jgi:hypothetical protein
VKDHLQTSSGRERTQTAAEQKRAERGDARDAARVPTAMRMPEGYEVVEHTAGRAVGQWVLQVRCQCGRRWFEIEPIDATHCPRCGLLVHVHIQAQGK